MENGTKRERELQVVLVLVGLFYFGWIYFLLFGALWHSSWLIFAATPLQICVQLIQIAGFGKRNPTACSKRIRVGPSVPGFANRISFGWAIAETPSWHRVVLSATLGVILFWVLLVLGASLLAISFLSKAVLNLAVTEDRRPYINCRVRCC